MIEVIEHIRVIIIFNLHFVFKLFLYFDVRGIHLNYMRVTKSPPVIRVCVALCKYAKFKRRQYILEVLLHNVLA